MTQPDVKYGPQPAYNEAFMPPGPPSYSEVVGASQTINPLYPVPPTMPANMYISHPPPPSSQQPVSLPPPTVPVCVGPSSSRVICPNCRAQVKTVTKSVSQKSAHIACFLMCMFGCFLCSCIPYCMKSFKDIHHYCPTCKTLLGSYKC